MKYDRILNEHKEMIYANNMNENISILLMDVNGFGTKLMAMAKRMVRSNGCVKPERHSPITVLVSYL
ncbi:hypothetical protein BLOT_012907 [Blomia tropicalis]|nr:hypothetical protein BLOT_012907 [Blomia tropicalis]